MSTKPLGWTAFAGYGVGDMANNLVFSMGMFFLLNYYTDVAGIGAAAAGTMLLLVRLYDALIDVVAGRVIDRTHFADGSKFRPYLLWAGLPLLLLNVAVFSVPAHWDSTQKLIYATLTYALLGTAYSFVNIPYGSLASVMTQIPRERSLLGAARTLMSTCTIVFLAFVLGPVLRNMHGEALQSRLTLLTFAMAGFGMLLYWVCFKTCKEIVVRDISQPKWKESMAALRSNRPLHMLCLIALFVLVGVSASGASVMYFARYVLGDARHFLTIILVTTIFGIAVSLPMVSILVRKIGKRGTFMAGMAIASLAKLALYFSPDVDHVVIFAWLAVGAAGSTLGMIVMWALESDTVEYGEWRTGVRIEGMNYSLFSLTRKCGQALGGSIPAFLLASSAYIPNLANQTPATIRVMWQSFVLVPAICYAMALLLMLFYPLTDRRFLELVQEIRERRGQGNGSRIA